MWFLLQLSSLGKTRNKGPQNTPYEILSLSSFAKKVNTENKDPEMQG